MSELSLACVARMLRPTLHLAVAFTDAVPGQWLDGTLSSEAPELWGWSPSEGDGKATLLLNDLLMHDVAQLAQAESYRASVPGACLLSVAGMPVLLLKCKREAGLRMQRLAPL